jgi:hypothetical protein
MGSLAKLSRKLKCRVPASCAEQRFRAAGGQEVLGVVRGYFSSVCQDFVRRKAPLRSFYIS